jgi:hypothetical protein
MSRVRGAGLAAVLVFGLAVAMPPSADAAPIAARTWLALGDSYSSGTGIEGTLYPGPEGKDCRRATGTPPGFDAPAPTAWPVRAFDAVRVAGGIGRIDLVACSGARTDDVTAQIKEATLFEGDRRWDIVSFTFGGNNLGFGEVMRDCIDIPTSWLEFRLERGCDVDEKTLAARVDALLGNGDESMFAGTVTMPQLLATVAGYVAPGGDVIVVGYPYLIDDPKVVSIFTCEGIHSDDVELLRGAINRLNQGLRRAVDAANADAARSGITYHYVSAESLFTNHGLCSSDSWLNGKVLLPAAGSPWIDVVSWYHPNQDGHDAIGQEVAALFDGQIRFDDLPSPVTIDWQNATIPVRCDKAHGTSFKVAVQDGLGRTDHAGSHYDVSNKTDLVSGDITGDGRPDSAMIVSCAPRPSNFVMQEIVVLDADGELLGHLPEGGGLASPSHFELGSLSIRAGVLMVAARVLAEGQCRACGEPELAEQYAWRWDGAGLVVKSG